MIDSRKTLNELDIMASEAGAIFCGFSQNLSIEVLVLESSNSGQSIFPLSLSQEHFELLNFLLLHQLEGILSGSFVKLSLSTFEA